MSRENPRPPLRRPRKLEELRPKRLGEESLFKPRLDLPDLVDVPDNTIVIETKERKALLREKEVLEMALLEERRALARESFWYFLTEILFPQTWEQHYSPNFHRPLCEEMQNLRQGENLWLFLSREFRKCPSVDTLVSYTDGSQRQAADVQVGDSVWGFDGTKTVPTQVVAVERYAPGPCVRVTFRSGRSITTSPQHPYRKLLGWVDADQLQPGDRIALARGLPPSTTNGLGQTEAAVLGWDEVEKVENTLDLPTVGIQTANETLVLDGVVTHNSHLLSMAHTWWMIVKDPDVRILLVGSREETVKPFARLILQGFLPGTPGMERFHSTFPDFVMHSRGKHDLRETLQFVHPLRRRTLADPTLRATFLGVSVAFRCDFLKWDDSVEMRQVSSPELSMKTLRQMLDMLPFVDTGSRYRNIMGAGTRLKYHDPYGRIIGEESSDNSSEVNEMLARLRAEGRTKVIIRHALEHPTRACRDCPPHVVDAYPHGAFDLDEGIPPDAPVHTRQMILDRYAEYCVDPERGESLFYHQYGNICRNPRNQKFREEWFITAPFPYFPVAKMKVLTIDSADKDFAMESGGDYMVALFGEFDDFGRLLLVNGLRSNKWTRAEFRKQIILYCKSTGWWPSRVAKEKYAQDTFLSDVRDDFFNEHQPVHCLAVTRPTTIGDQATRRKADFIVASLQAPMERAEVVFGRDFPPAIRLRAKYEMMNLGQTRLDDVADALAIFFAPGVRPETPVRAPSGADGWTAPGLGSYGVPEGLPTLPPLTPWESAIMSEGVQAAFSELPQFQAPSEIARYLVPPIVFDP